MKLENRRLLLVDDDGVILATVGKGLRDAGYAVSLAGSGEIMVGQGNLVKEKARKTDPVGKAVQGPGQIVTYKASQSKQKAQTDQQENRSYCIYYVHSAIIKAS